MRFAGLLLSLSFIVVRRVIWSSKLPSVAVKVVVSSASIVSRAVMSLKSFTVSVKVAVGKALLIDQSPRAITVVNLRHFHLDIRGWLLRP
jgi:hypothetical protein